MNSYPVLVVEAAPEDVDLLIGRLTLLGAEGIEQRDATTLTRGGTLGATLIASFATEDEARTARDTLSKDHPVRLDAVVGDAWRDGWKEHWQPTRITPRVVIVPSWMSYTAEPGDRVLELDPGRAFGTGQHASTVLCARALERRLGAGETPARVVDLGTGSGILSMVAVVLGVRNVIACDIDPESVAAAIENVERVGYGEQIKIRVGSVDAIPETAPLVVANIEASVLIPLAPAVAARVAPGGVLVLSGILAEQRDAVEKAYAAEGLTLDRCDGETGWIAPEFVRADVR